jgi:glycerol uptake facilitator protein
MKGLDNTHKLVREIVGSLILILLGIGAVAHVALAPRLEPGAYNWMMIALGWGLAYGLAFFLVGGIKQAHLNPAITLAFAFRKEFSWKKVLPTIGAQFFGAILGAAAAWFMYKDGLAPAGFPNIWATGPGATFDGVFWGGNSTSQISTYRVVVACVAELFGTLVLIWTVLAIRDSSKDSKNNYWEPIMIVFAVIAIGISLGGPSGFAINPARDLAPRILGSLLGTPGLFDGVYWFLPPLFVPLMAGPLGVVLYDMIINRPGARS